jgi:hypothetical protein
MLPVLAIRLSVIEPDLVCALANQVPIDVMNRSEAHGPPLVEQAGNSAAA